MDIVILFNGKEYVQELLPEGATPYSIRGEHPGYMFLDHASSLEEADIKIERDRDRHKPQWT